MNLKDGRLPQVCMTVVCDSHSALQCLVEGTIQDENLAVRQLSGDSAVSTGNGSDFKGISLASYDPEELAAKQHADPAFRFLMDFLKSRLTPRENELVLSGPEEKCYYLESSQFKLDDKGVIWKVNAPDPDRLLVPRSLRNEVLSLLHNIPSLGHQRVQRTKGRARDNFYWCTDIKTYVFRCDICCWNKRGSLPLRSGLKSYQAGTPMEKVHLDFLGPLPRAESGNEYMLMMVDSFTKWVECVPLLSQTAEVTASGNKGIFCAVRVSHLRFSPTWAETLRASCSERSMTCLSCTSHRLRHTDSRAIGRWSVITTLLWMRSVLCGQPR